MNETTFKVMSARELRQRREEAVAGLGAMRRMAAELDPRAHLELADDAIATTLEQPLLSLCAEAKTLLSELSEMFDEHDEVPLLCFAARTELAQARRGLERRGSREARFVACDVARQRLLRSIAAVAGAVERRQQPAPWEDGRSAAVVRAMYMRLRAAFEASGEPTQQLARLEAAFEEMRARGEYTQVRLADRFLLDDLRDRVVAARGKDTGEPAAQLLSDVASALQLLSGINLRPELREHDLHSMAWLTRELEAGTTTRAGLVQARELLRGRDPELDEALKQATATLKPDPEVRQALLDALRRVKGQLE